jgi:DNA-binding LytR/AlgR family response regulator
MHMRAIIADDEQALLEHLKRLLQKLWPELEISAEAANGKAALEVIRREKPDIAFLDIRMPGLSGMEVAAQLDTSCRVVFITAYDHYAVQAFEHHAVDYLLKPLTEARLQQTISRLKQPAPLRETDLATMLRQLSVNLSAEPKQPLQWVRAQQGEGVQLIHVDDIAYFKSEDKYTIVRLRQSEQIIRTPLKQLEESLDNNQFWRIHRNAIVNLCWVDKIERHFGGKLSIHLKHIPDELTVSRSYAHLFQQM